MTVVKNNFDINNIKNTVLQCNALNLASRCLDHITNVT